MSEISVRHFGTASSFVNFHFEQHKWMRLMWLKGAPHPHTSCSNTNERNLDQVLAHEHYICSWWAAEVIMSHRLVMRSTWLVDAIDAAWLFAWALQSQCVGCGLTRS